MTKVLITGSAGMIGSHLAEAVLSRGHDLVATYLHPTINMTDIAEILPMRELDVCDFAAVSAMFDAERPDIVYHLAAQSLPTVSWEDPWRTLNTNAIGTVNVFEAIKRVRLKKADYDPVVVTACSSAEYGASMTLDRVPVDEDAPLLPLHPYGVSKVAQDLLTFQYSTVDRIRGVRARIFNCTGPRKRNDVVSDFARGAAQALRDGTPMRVGNLKTRRAIIDVRDMVEALMLLADRGVASEAYNICADQLVSIDEILQAVFTVVGRPLSYEIDPMLLRPSDEPVIYGSTRKLREATGWAPKIDLTTTIRDVLAYEQAHPRDIGP